MPGGGADRLAVDLELGQPEDLAQRMARHLTLPLQVELLAVLERDRLEAVGGGLDRVAGAP